MILCGNNTPPIAGAAIAGVLIRGCNRAAPLLAAAGVAFSSPGFTHAQPLLLTPVSAPVSAAGSPLPEIVFAQAPGSQGTDGRVPEEAESDADDRERAGISAQALVIGGVAVLGGLVAALSGAFDDDSGRSENDGRTDCSAPKQGEGTYSAGYDLGGCSTAAGNLLKEDGFTLHGEGNNGPRTYDVINLGYATAAGYDGKDQLIHIMDYSLDTEHPEFRDRVVGTDGTQHESDEASEHNHGTHVAGIAVAARDGEGMTGVASGAKIYFTSYRKSEEDASGDKASREQIGFWTEGYRQAHEKGAIVSNNSWGYRDSVVGGVDPGDVLDLMDLDPALSDPGNAISAVVYSSPGFAAKEYDALAEAFEAFQEKGVIVWANGNNARQTHPGLLSTFPAFYAKARESGKDYPDIMKAWISVSNVDLYERGRGEVKHRFVSAPCGEVVAEYCLIQMGGGISDPVRSTFRDGEYDDLYGTSMAAPQVSGAVAILTQAFPKHTPAEITARLLATADNELTRFGGHDSGDRKVDTRDFGNGVTHDYYRNSGHGIMDLKKALSPIGPLTVASRDSAQPAAYARRALLGETRLAAGKAFGKSVDSALAGRSISLFDALNGAFPMDAGDLLTPTDARSRAVEKAVEGVALLSDRREVALGRSLSLRFRAGAGGQGADIASGLSLRFMREGAGEGSDVFSVGYRQDHASLFGFADADPPPVADALSEGAFALSFLDELRDGFALSWERGTGGEREGSVSLLVGRKDVPEGDPRQTGRSNGALVGRLGVSPAPRVRLSFVAGGLFEGETFLGAKGAGALAVAKNTRTGFGSVSAKLALTDDTALIAGYAAGLTRPVRRAGAIFDSFSILRSEQFSLALARAGMFLAGDRLSLSVSRPMRIVEGKARMSLATGRDRQGVAQFETLSVDLAPAGRQTDFAIGWDAPIGEGFAVGVGLAAHLQPGHDARAGAEISALLRFDYRF